LEGAGPKNGLRLPSNPRLADIPFGGATETIPGKYTDPESTPLTVTIPDSGGPLTIDIPEGLTGKRK
jgi:hypothetical protein